MVIREGESKVFPVSTDNQCFTNALQFLYSISIYPGFRIGNFCLGIGVLMTTVEGFPRPPS